MKKIIIFFLFIIWLSSFSFAGISDNIYSYYKMDDTSGTTITDTLNNNNGTFSGWTLGNAGIINKDYTVTATKYGTLSDTNWNFLSDTTQNWTVSEWVKITSDTGNDAYLFSKGTSATTRFDIHLARYSGTDYRPAVYQWKDGTHERGRVCSTNVYNGWHFVVARQLANSDLNIYVDGTLCTGVDNTNTYSTISPTGSMQMNTVSWSLGAAGVAGGIDEAGVWKRALSTTEITQLYNSGAGLAYPFNISTCTYGGSGDWTVNLSDNCNLTTDTNIGANKFTTTGTGTLKINAWIYANEFHLIGSPIYWQSKGLRHQ